MQRIGLIGFGAIAQHILKALPESSAELAFVIARPGRESAAMGALGRSIPVITRIENAPLKADLIVDCAGHGGLRDHGVAILEAGIPLLTVSVGALADDAFANILKEAAIKGKTRLCLASGAIGALDALSSAQTGDLESVTYTGRKPPKGWLGSAAEDKVDLLNITEPTSHFKGSARDAARLYPKNANVAAAVALAGIGFDATSVELIADPSITENIHEIHAMGSFGNFTFQIEGSTLPDNPRTSALAAMSLVRAIRDHRAAITF